MLGAVHRQADRVFVYLDGYSEPPDFLRRYERITVHGAEATADLHAAARFLCVTELETPAVVAIVDDDILYPRDYFDRLADALDAAGGQAVVGVHGRTFLPPHQSYIRDATVTHFAEALKDPRHVHEVGAGTCAFVSDRLPVDPRLWDRHDMNDLRIAIEAQKRGLPRIAVARPAKWLTALAEGQTDSLWRKTQRDDTEHSRRMRALLNLY